MPVHGGPSKVQGAGCSSSSRIAAEASILPVVGLRYTSQVLQFGFGARSRGSRGITKSLVTQDTHSTLFFYSSSFRLLASSSGAVFLGITRSCCL
mmetsp:Transcript_21857/g.47271  ORF Transcript_21857/g.47271 Transcript_21857/m.47271 type:complete len:95 (-) Transcript_21857:1768-2052(-)